MQLDLPEPSRVDHVSICEDIAAGERIRAYTVEGQVGADRWTPLCQGESVGHRRIQRFDPVEVAASRLCITEFVSEPQIRELSVYGCDG